MKLTKQGEVMLAEFNMMADKPDDDDGGDDGDFGVALETKPKTKRPPMYKVMILNDDFTPMEFVVMVLERFFGMTHAQSFELMLTVHKKGLAVVGISSNDVEGYPQDGPEEMKQEAVSAGYKFPYLYDADQSVAKAYKAACTPDFFLFDKDHSLVYRGQFDSSRPGNEVPVTGEDLRVACDAVLNGNDVSAVQKPAIGCNIKWKAGAEPEYFTGQSAV